LILAAMVQKEYFNHRGHGVHRGINNKLYNWYDVVIQVHISVGSSKFTLISNQKNLCVLRVLCGQFVLQPKILLMSQNR